MHLYLIIILYLGQAPQGHIGQSQGHVGQGHIPQVHIGQGQGYMPQGQPPVAGQQQYMGQAYQGQKGQHESKSPPAQMAGTMSPLTFTVFYL